MAGIYLSLHEAARIVIENCPRETPDIDHTLERIGLITHSQRIAFRDSIYGGVLDAGYRMDPHEIPIDADTTLREIRDTLQARAVRPPGDPTTPPPPPRKRR